MNRLPSLVRQHIAALRMLLAFTVLCGIVYPVVMWGINQAAFKASVRRIVTLRASLTSSPS